FFLAAPYQELEPRKGHVPVYIRHGDEALSNIHPGLAEAFNEPSPAQTLQAENLVQEVPATNAPAAATDDKPTKATTTANDDVRADSSTVSDIASFDVIKAKEE
ncbi:hypothetical protein KR093_002486, partial [Drosophila rubida]